MDELEEKLNFSEDFANIDDLLDDKEADNVKIDDEVVKNESSVSFDERDDGFEHDCADNDMSVHVGISKVPKEEEGAEKSDAANVFSSGILDELLGQKMEIAKREIFPTNLAMAGISEVKAAAREVIEQQLEARETLEGLRAGLGQQQKSRMKMRMQNASQCPKVKTLAMKREKLAEDIMRYGVAAIERLYPRQQQQKQQNQVIGPGPHDVLPTSSEFQSQIRMDNIYPD